MDKSLLPKVNDMVTESIMMEESYSTLGTKVKIILAESFIPQIGFHHDIVYKEDDPIYTNIFIHEPPEPKLLKNLGWNFESDDDYTKPMLVSMPRYLSTKSEDGLKPTEYYEVLMTRFSKIYIDWDYDRPDRVFQVMNVSSNMFNPVFYFMKLVPYREDIAPDPLPTNDPNLDYTRIEGQFKYLTMTPREDGTKIKY